MKTLQTQYNLIKEGKGSKHIFLKEAKNLFPDMITNAATFEQTEKILKNRGIINENFVGLQPINGWESPAKEDYELAFKKFLSEIEGEKIKAETKKVSKYVEDTDANNFDNEDRKNINNLSGQQVLNGFYAELKSPKNADKTKEELMDIVAKNLSKDPLYYVKGGQFGTEGVGYTEDAPGLGKPKEAKGKYKSSGYGDLDNKPETPKANVKDLGEKEYKTGMPKKVKEMEVKPKNSKGVKKMPTPGKPKTVKLNEIGMFHDPIGYDKRAKSQMEVARDILMNAGLSDEEIEKFISNNIFKKGRLDDLSKEYVKSLKGLNEIENMGMDLETAKVQAQTNSKEGYTQHVNKNEDGTYSISDWYDSDTTVCSYENGMPLNENQQSPEDELKSLLKNHDWYFEMSDDHKKYTPGKESEKKILSLVKSLGDKGKEIYNSKAPKNRQMQESVVDKLVESIFKRFKKSK